MFWISKKQSLVVNIAHIQRIYKDGEVAAKDPWTIYFEDKYNEITDEEYKDLMDYINLWEGKTWTFLTSSNKT